MIGRLNHVAIAVPDLEKAVSTYRDVLGASVKPPQDEPDHGVTVVFIELPNTKIELLYPLGENSPIKALPTWMKSGAFSVSRRRYERWLRAGADDEVLFV